MMRERWRRLWANVGAAGDPDASFDDLAERYAEAGRVYHSLRHIEHTLAEIDAVRSELRSPDRVKVEAVFTTEAFRRRYEAQARENLARAVGDRSREGERQARLRTGAACGQSMVRKDAR